MNTSSRSRHGSVIAMALIFAILLGLLLFSLVDFGLTERRLNSRHATWTDARYAAESALEYATGEMFNRLKKRAYISPTTMMSSGTPLALPGADFFAGSSIDYSSMEIAGGRFSEPVSVFIPRTATNGMDPLRGKRVLIRNSQIFAKATAVDRATGARITYWCSTTLQDRRPRGLQSLGDYLPDLEIAPGAEMFCYGDFKTAGNLYYQSNKGLSFYAPITCKGQLFWGRKPGSGQSTGGGDVSLVNDDGALVSFKQGGNWVQSSTANFEQLALSLWDGNLLTGAHDVDVPTLPGFDEYTPYDPSNPASNSVHQIIELPIPNNAGAAYNLDIETQKYSVRAGLVISIDANGTVKAYHYVKDPTGKYTRYSSGSGEPDNYRREEVTLPTGMVSTSSMVDQRRDANALKIYNVDVEKLVAAINGSEPTKQIGNFDKDHDWNSIVFVEVASPAMAGVRLQKGSVIPDHGQQSGMIFGTNAPLYVHGNFNADGVLPATQKLMGAPEGNEPPAALVADAITILSNNWNDANSSKSIGNRIPTTTEVSAALIGGIVPTKDNKYSGGFENYPRFLEKWTGVTFGYRGAVVALFDSEIATQAWPGTGTVYDAPTRLWAYNELFAQAEWDPFEGRPYPNRIGFTEYHSEAEYAAALAAARTPPSP